MAFETFKEMRNLGSINKGLNKDVNQANDSFNSRYNPAAAWEETPARNNFQTYPYDYFCGTNAKIFFGDIWVDDVVTLEYSVRQDKEPIYGYASQHFDAMARGVVIVQGTFTIAFKEMGYLNVVQSTLESQRNRASSQQIQRKLNEKLELANNGQLAFDPRLARALDPGSTNKRTFNATGQPEIIRQQQTIEDILRYKRGTSTVASGLAEDFLDGNVKERDFEDFAEVLEDTIWGDANGRPQLGAPYKFRRADEFDYNWEGNQDLGGIKVATKTPAGADYSQVLNILVTFGDINDYRAEHTMVALNDVHIINSSMVVSPTGDPIAETYMFIARDINQTLSRDTLETLSPLKYNVGTGEEGFTTPKIEDIKAIENFLSKGESNLEITLQSLSKFYFSDAQKYDSWSADTGYYEVIPFTKSFNPWDSKLDQIIKIVERTINDPAGFFSTNNTSDAPVTDSGPSGSRTDYAQWLIKAMITPQGGGEVQEINMILDQQIPNTLTYRVISPTRDNFGSYSAFTRADMWKIDKPQTPEPEIDAKTNAEATTLANSDGTIGGRSSGPEYDRSQDPLLSQIQDTGELSDQEKAALEQPSYGPIREQQNQRDQSVSSPTHDQSTSNSSSETSPLVTRSRADTRSTLENVAAYNQSISTAARSAGISRAELSALIGTESSGRQESVSSVGAVGLTQLTGPAIQDVNEMTGRSVTREMVANDPQLNIEYGSKYFSNIKRQVREDEDLVRFARENNVSISTVTAGAYNRGLAGLRRDIVRGRVAPETRQQMGNYQAFLDEIYDSGDELYDGGSSGGGGATGNF